MKSKKHLNKYLYGKALRDFVHGNRCTGLRNAFPVMDADSSSWFSVHFFPVG